MAKRKTTMGLEAARTTKPKNPISDYKMAKAAGGKAQAAEPAIAFSVVRSGKKKVYNIRPGFGYFIPSLKRAEDLTQVNELVEAGIQMKEIADIVEYLGLKVPEVAKAAAVSASTVSRWQPNASIGPAGSGQFFRMDEVIRKGAELFGGLDELKFWLHNPNVALGNEIPAKLMITQIGVDMVDEALDALHYGNIL